MAFRTALNVKLKSELYNQVINTDQMVIVPGESNWDDSEFRFYYWNADSTATDDGENVIKPTAIVDAGRYIKFTKTQFKPDWNASSGLAQIQNKPTIGTGTVTSVGMSSSDLTISGGPVTTSGTLTVNLNNTGITSGNYGVLTVDSKGRATAGKRMELYSGTTNASGVYTVTFGTAYSATPHIQANITNQANLNQFVRVTSVSTTGFTINVFQRNSVTLLSTDLLLATTVNVNGATIDVLVAEK